MAFVVILLFLCGLCSCTRSQLTTLSPHPHPLVCPLLHTPCAQPVTRKYAFDKSEVPEDANWLKVVYSAKFPAVEAAGWSGKTFSHVSKSTP